MGYIVLSIIGAVLLVAFVVIAARNKKPQTGRISSEGQAILREEPAADEATPGRSVTASPAQARNAQKRTPPA